MLLDEYGDAKLTDFGLSKSFKGDIDFNESAGSPMYAAPEVLLGQPHKGYISDIWSLGICLYVMVCGDFPFISENMRDYIQSVAINKFELPEYVSPLFIDLINKILAKNPKKRLNIKQIKEHPWLHSFDFNFMKSPGVIINRDILPIDIQVIKDSLGDCKQKFYQAWRVTNKATQNRFDNFVKNEDIKDIRLFWHGSRNENWWSILNTGLVLRPTNAVITGKMFGMGTYFSPTAKKSLGYTSLDGSYWAGGRSNSAFMGLMKVAYGIPYDVYSFDSCYYMYDYKNFRQQNLAQIASMHMPDRCCAMTRLSSTTRASVLSNI